MGEMTQRVIEVRTADGVCPVHLHTPGGDGPWPGLLMYMDGPGMRPAMHQIAARTAANGYAVALPDLFYRAGPYPPVDPKVVWPDPELKAAHRTTLMETAKPPAVMRDTATIFDAMDAAPEIAPGLYGVFGYCMGGRLALIAAGTYPERIAVAASFHGGGLANDTPTSPHLLADRMRAKVYVAGAIEDANFDDAMKARLEAALTAATVDHRIETYPAKHGWVPTDMPVHDPAQAEHHWRVLIPLLDGVLKPR